MATIEIPRLQAGASATLLPDFDGCAYLNLETYKIDSQRAVQKGSSGIYTTKQDYTFKFLLPENFQETVQHTWADYTSITSEIAQRVLPILQKVGGGASMIGNTMKTGLGNNFSQSTDIIGTSENAISMRFDAALTYQTSARRRYMFELHFADCGDTYQDVIYPIKLLEKLSCASLESGFAQITRPYIFRVYTTPSKFIYLRYAALESILPSYSGPYRNGYPTNASAQLSFIELDPLYQSQFETELQNSSSNNTSSSGVQIDDILKG